ncbi:MAG: glycosyltransferase, partial [Waterburya sp.]
LYQPQNQADFLDKLTRLITDPQLRQSMGSQAQALAQQYSWQHTVGNLVEIWSQAVKNKSHSTRSSSLN